MGDAVEVQRPPMDQGRAMQLCKRIRQNMTSARDDLVELYEGEGWTPLGYKSWRECVTAEFGEHERTLYRQLEAAKVIREITQGPDVVFDTCVKNKVSERSLTALAKAPVGKRAEVLKVAAEASEGRPTEKVVKAAVDAKWATPDATPAELVKTVVNGVAKADAAVEKARAAGKIRPDATVHVEDPGDEATDVEAVREEHEERIAKAEDLPDDEWLATLPVNGKIRGPQLKAFQVDALAYRELEPHRKTFEHFLRRIGKAAKQKSNIDLGYINRIFRLVLIQHPKDWKPCPATESGGCGGSGQVPMIGECAKCHGRGYILQ